MSILPTEDDDSFCPSDDRLVDHYLRAKIAGKMSRLPNACYFENADVCSARPDDLVRDHGVPARVPAKEAGGGEQWLFFSPVRFTGGSMTRRSRTVDGTGDTECWHAEGRPRLVEGGGGFVQKFSYHVKVAPGVVEKPGWIMAEYTIKGAAGEGDTVLCKIYRSPRGPGRNRKKASLSLSSAAAAKSRCKRKGAGDLEAASSSKRRRGARETEEEEDDDYMPSAGDMASDYLLPVEEWRPEPQHAPVIGEYTSLMLTEEEVDDLMVLGLSDDGSKEDPEAPYNQQQDYTVETVHGSLTVWDLVVALVTGQSIPVAISAFSEPDPDDTG